MYAMETSLDRGFPDSQNFKRLNQTFIKRECACKRRKKTKQKQRNVLRQFGDDGGVG
jgi:hypothetical protein